MQGLLFADCVPEEQNDADQEEEEEEEEPEVWDEPWSDFEGEAAAAPAAAAARPEQLDKELGEEAQQQQQEQPPPEHSSRSKLARLLALRVVYGKQPPAAQAVAALG